MTPKAGAQLSCTSSEPQVSHSSMAATNVDGAACNVWPVPVPSEWKDGRKAKAQEWFQRARDDKIRCFIEAEVQVQLDQKAAAAAAHALSQQEQQVQAFKQLQASTRRAAETLICSRAAATALARTPPEHLLRFPHHTALRPVMILDAAQPDVCFPEQLLVRGIVSTLLANMHIPDPEDTDVPAWAEQSGSCAVTPAPAGDEDAALPHSLRGFSELLQPGCGGTDFLWWGPMQPEGTCDDLGLARLEVLWRCRLCILILSSSLVNGPSWPDDRQVLAARLLGQADDDDHPLSLLVVKVSTSPHSPPPDLQLPQPPSGTTTTTRVTVIEVPAMASYHDQVKLVIESIRTMLQQQMGVHLPPAKSTCDAEDTLTLAFTPATAVRHATKVGYVHQPSSCLRNSMSRLGCEAVAGAGSLSQGLKPRASVTSLSSATAGPQLTLPGEQATGVLAALERMGPSMGATQDPGQMEYGESWVVAHSLGNSAASKPLGLWCVDDVDAWVRRTCGAAASAAASVLLQYGIDGQLLRVMQPQHLMALVGSQPWLKMLSEAVAQLQRNHHVHLSKSALPSPCSINDNTIKQAQLNGGMPALSQSLLLMSGVWRPGVAPGADDPFLITSSIPQLEQRFLEAVRFYDVDCTGDLDALEMHKLITACGVDLSTAEAAQVLKEYDQDKDGKLCRQECLDVMWDIGRLMLASRDCTAWNVPCMTATGSSSTLRRHLLLHATRQHTDTAAELSSATAALDGSSLGATAQSRWETASGKSSIRTDVSSRRATSEAVSMAAGTAAGRPQRYAQGVTGHPKPPAVAASATVQTHSPATDSIQAVEDIQAVQDKAQPVRRRPPKRGVSFAQLQAQQQDETASKAAGDGKSSSDRQPPPQRGAGTKSAGLNQATLDALGQGRAAAPWAGTRSRHASMAGGGFYDDDDHGDEELPGNDGVSCSSSKRAATVATDLDVFADPLLLVSTTQLRDTLDPDTLAMSLTACFAAADLQRRGSLTPAALRSALTTTLANESCLAGGGASLHDTFSSEVSPRSCTARRPSACDNSDMEPATLSPAELQLVSCAVLEQQQQQQQAMRRPGTSTGGVPIRQFVNAAVEAVAASQQQLVDVVYGSNGTQRLLASLHTQKYPGGQGRHDGSLSGCSTNLLGGGVHQAQASTSAVASITSSALASTKVPFQAAPALLDVVINKQQLQGAVPLLVRVGLLQEAAAAGERCAGSGTEVDAWSATAAHMLHVWSKLQSAQHHYVYTSTPPTPAS